MAIWVWILVFSLLVLCGTLWWFQTTSRAPIDWQLDLESATFLSEAAKASLPRTLHLTGSFPTRIYVSNSSTIVVNGASSPTANLDFEVPRGVKVQLQLLAAAFDIDGERRQQKAIPLAHDRIQYFWNITPKKAGAQTISMAASWLDDSNQEHELDLTTLSVNVVEVIGLSPRTIKWFSIVAGVLTLVVAAAGAAASF